MLGLNVGRAEGVCCRSSHEVVNTSVYCQRSDPNPQRNTDVSADRLAPPLGAFSNAGALNQYSRSLIQAEDEKVDNTSSTRAFQKGSAGEQMSFLWMSEQKSSAVLRIQLVSAPEVDLKFGDSSRFN